VHVLLMGLMNDPKYYEFFTTLGDSRDAQRNRLEVISNITDWVDGNDFVDTVCTITGDQSTGQPGQLRCARMPRCDPRHQFPPGGLGNRVAGSAGRIGHAQTATCHQSQVTRHLRRRLGLSQQVAMRKAHNAFHHDPGVAGVC
jgi:hypothetical protein